MGEIFGKDGNSTQDAAATAAQTQAELAKQMWAEGAQLRKGTFGVMEGVLRGESPLGMPTFMPAREAIENQYGVAREQVLSGVPARGGEMNTALANVDIARAKDVGGLESNLRNQLFTQALSAGTGFAPYAISGTGQAAQTLGALGTAQQQAAAQSWTGTGQMLGKLGAAYMGKPAGAAAGAGAAGAGMMDVAPLALAAFL